MYMRHVLAFRGPNNGSTPRCLRNQTLLQERRLFQKESSHLKPCCIIFCQKLTFLCYFLQKTKGTYLICKNTWLSPYILALGRVCYDDKHLFKSFNAVVLNFRIKLQQLILGNNSYQIPRYCNDVVGYITGFRAAALFFQIYEKSLQVKQKHGDNSRLMKFSCLLLYVLSFSCKHISLDVCLFSIKQNYKVTFGMMSYYISIGFTL